MTYVKDRERRFRNPLKQTFFPGALRNGKNVCLNYGFHMI